VFEHLSIVWTYFEELLKHEHDLNIVCVTVERFKRDLIEFVVESFQHLIEYRCDFAMANGSCELNI